MDSILNQAPSTNATKAAAPVAKKKFDKSNLVLGILIAVTVLAIAGTIILIITANTAE